MAYSTRRARAPASVGLKRERANEFQLAVSAATTTTAATESATAASCCATAESTTAVSTVSAPSVAVASATVVAASAPATAAPSTTPITAVDSDPTVVGITVAVGIGVRIWAGVGITIGIITRDAYANTDAKTNRRISLWRANEQEGTRQR